MHARAEKAFRAALEVEKTSLWLKNAALAAALGTSKDERPGGDCIACDATVLNIKRGLCPDCFERWNSEGRPDIEKFKRKD